MTPTICQTFFFFSEDPIHQCKSIGQTCISYSIDKRGTSRVALFNNGKSNLRVKFRGDVHLFIERLHFSKCIETSVVKVTLVRRQNIINNKHPSINMALIESYASRALLVYEGLKIWWHAMIMMAMMPIGPIHFSCLHLLSTWHICQLLSGRKFYGSASVQPPIPRHLSSRVLALCHRLRWAEQLACCTVIHDSRTNLSIQQHGKRWWPCCSKRSEPSNNNNVFFLEENTTDDKRNQTPIFLRRSTGH